MPTSSFTRKRRIEEETDGDGESDPEPMMSVDKTTLCHPNRPVKPLRKSTFSKSHSSPAAFGPVTTASALPTPLSTASEEEEDWSTEMGTLNDRVQPMLF